MAKHRIAVLSDTHGLLRPEVIEILKSCEVIFHGGDINSPEIVKQMEEISPLHIVRGNNDKEWANDIPLSVETKLFGFDFFMCHKKKDIPETVRADFIIYGHSHKYEIITVENSTWINPGSCGPRRFHQPVTMAVLVVDDETHDFSIEKIDMSTILGKNSGNDVSLSDKDLDKLVSAVIKDMDAGKSMEIIANRNRVDIELVDSICRMYSTHPGVTVGGIIDKLELRKIYKK